MAAATTATETGTKKSAKKSAAAKGGDKPAVAKTDAKVAETKPPAVPTIKLKAHEAHKTVLVPLSKLLIDQTKNNRADPVSLKEPDAKFVLLAASVRKDGLLNAIAVKKLPAGFKFQGKTADGAIHGHEYDYEVVAGYRRAMAHNAFNAAVSGTANVTMHGGDKRTDTVTLGDEDTKYDFSEVTQVECKIVEVENAYDVAVLRGIENVQREDLTGYEMAKLVWDARAASKEAGLGDKQKGLDIKVIAADMGISRSHAVNLWRTKDLIRPFMKAFESGSIGVKDAIRYCGMEKEDQQKAYEAWESRHEEKEGDNEGKGGKGPADKKMLSKKKIEELDVDVENAIRIKIGGKWTDMNDDLKAGARAAIRWILSPPTNGYLFELPEEESDEEEGE